MAPRVREHPRSLGGLIIVVSNPRHAKENKSYKPFSKECFNQTINNFFNNKTIPFLT